MPSSWATKSRAKRLASWITSESAVTEFLRDALAIEALGVPKLDAMARPAGLLGEGQDITGAKLRSAKCSMGIRSIRDDFGVGGRWAWELPRSSEGKAPNSSQIGPRSPPAELCSMPAAVGSSAG
jgi:hypothetical protein